VATARKMTHKGRFEKTNPISRVRCGTAALGCDAVEE